MTVLNTSSFSSQSSQLYFLTYLLFPFSYAFEPFLSSLLSFLPSFPSSFFPFLLLNFYFCSISVLCTLLFFYCCLLSISPFLYFTWSIFLLCFYPFLFCFSNYFFNVSFIASVWVEMMSKGVGRFHSLIIAMLVSRLTLGITAPLLGILSKWLIVGRYKVWIHFLLSSLS